MFTVGVEPHRTGFKVAAMEIAEGMASHAGARERGLFKDDRKAREAWDAGYEDCVCAYRLGHDVKKMIGFDVYGPSIVPVPELVAALLDGRWKHRTRPDPRR